MRKFKFKIIVLLLLFSFGIAVPGSADAKTTKTSKAWASAYMKIVKNANKEDNKSKGGFFYTPYEYDLVYFDKDSIPELVVGKTGYWVSMYSYSKSKKKVYTVMDHYGYGAMGNTGYSYLPKKNVMCNINNDQAGAIENYYYSVMKNYKMVSKYPKSLMVMHYKDKNKNGYCDGNEADGKSYYYYGGKKITKKKFNSYIVKGNFKFLSGTKSYSEIKKTLRKKGAK